MNEERYFFNWSCCELVMTKTGDKAIDSEANKFFRATMDYCKEVRSNIRSYLEALASVLNGQGYNALEMRVKGEMLDQYICCDYEETDQKKRFTVFTDVDFMEQNNIGRNLYEVPAKKYDPNVKVSMILPVTESMEKKFEEIKQDPFPLYIKKYLTKLGIYEECLAIHLDEEDTDIDFMNVIMMAYTVLEEKIGSGVTMKFFFSDGGIVGFTESESSAEMGRLSEIEVDESIFTDEPDQKWYLNLSSICIHPITDYESAGMTREEYESLARAYLGDHTDALMRKIDSGNPFEVYAFTKRNHLCGEEILEMTDGIRKCFLFNMEMAQRLAIDLEDFPDAYQPHGFIDGEMEVFQSLFAFSRDFRLVEIPLMPMEDAWELVLTRYWGAENIC